MHDPLIWLDMLENMNRLDHCNFFFFSDHFKATDMDRLLGCLQQIKADLSVFKLNVFT